MPLTHIEYGSLASSSLVNNNFDYLSDRISEVSNSLTSATASINSNISGINGFLSEQIETLASNIEYLNSDLQDLRNDFKSQNNAPDYSRGVGISLPYTVTEDGYVYAGVSGYDYYDYVYVNEKIVHGHCGYSGGINVYSGSVFRVSKGDVVSVGRQMESYYFYPMKYQITQNQDEGV